jgi:hypothetical protein
MNRKIFDRTNPFTVPEGYFDTLQCRIMERIQAEERHAKGRTLRMTPLRAWVAAAACVLFIFTGAALYVAHTGNRQSVIAESVVDDEFYRWVFAADRATFLAESLDIQTPDDILANENNFEEDEAIINFLERDSVNVLAIALLMVNY